MALSLNTASLTPVNRLAPAARNLKLPRCLSTRLALRGPVVCGPPKRSPALCVFIAVGCSTVQKDVPVSPVPMPTCEGTGFGEYLACRWAVGRYMPTSHGPIRDPDGCQK
ncbi:hypothetical protein B0J13DRAFT_526884 [Dactylonectria estremocensis]|uniref:Uncharacterized protein n=1 Tax=Dactylonectria estremocensis TaxID=1079267 RepID=A0A9P9EN45_9HYPO|nr:hypothetical protein B0J13DRAFT_526884 [Dactylonectria estremocensis]